MTDAPPPMSARPVPPRPQELLLVALGAVPGALLRWQLHLDPLANLLGCLLIGMSLALQPPRPRLILLLAIGFCGSLTTFSGWIAALATALRQGSGGAVGLLVLELLAGILAVIAGRALVNRPIAARPSARRSFRR